MENLTPEQIAANLVRENKKLEFEQLVKDLNKNMFTKNLASYIADYVNEELDRGNEIDREVILHAIDAYEGGAR